MGKRTQAQLKTLSTFKKIDENIYSLNYQNEYFLDECLDASIGSLLPMLKFVQKSFKMKNVKKNKKDEFACSVFNAYTKDGDHIVGRNFDYMDAPLMILWTAPKNGYKSVSVCNVNFMLYTRKLIWPMEGKKINRLLFAPYASMDGVNEKGFTISILEIKTALTHQKNSANKDFQTTTAIRAALDKCATVEEGIALFEKYNMNDAALCNYHYLITDASGKAAVIEYANDKMIVIKNDDNGTKVLANFYLAEGCDNSNAFGQQRAKYIESVLKEKNNILDENEAMQILDNTHLDFTHRRGYQIISLWSDVFNSTEKSLTVCGKMDYDHPYKVYADRPDYVEKLTKTQVTTIKDFTEFTHKDVEYK